MVEFSPGPENYELYTVIGKCCNEAGQLHVALHRPTQDLVAVKKINLDHCHIDLALLRHEVLMERLIHHPNMQPCLCSFVADSHLWMVRPLMAFGSCKDLLQAHFSEGLPETAIAYILRDVLLALDYLHTHGLIHRSVRASHILISARGHVCLSGLRFTYNMLQSGLRSKVVHDFPESYVNSLLWASPELLEQNLAGYNTKCDVYSVGITACELANGGPPFADMPVTQMLLEKVEGTTPQLIDMVTMPELQQASGESAEGGAHIPFQRTFSQHFRNFVELCLSSDPKQRPTASVLLQHSFFKQIKRKSGADPLIDLLSPVTPITDVSSLPKEESGMVDSLTDSLEATTMEDHSWLF